MDEKGVLIRGEFDAKQGKIWAVILGFVIAYPLAMINTLTAYFVTDEGLFTVLMLMISFIMVIAWIFIYIGYKVVSRKVNTLLVTDNYVSIDQIDFPRYKINSIKRSIFCGLTINLKEFDREKISLYFLKNRDEVLNILTYREEDCKIETAEEGNISIIDNPIDGDVEKLRALQTLLDSGLITQEDFDAKKKQILGL